MKYGLLRFEDVVFERWCFVIIYTKLKLLCWIAVPVDLTWSLFGCSSGLPCSNMCDLYMMNHEGPQFWHIVLSWESLAKRLNSPQCKNAWQHSGIFERPLSIFRTFNKQLGHTVFAWPHESYTCSPTSSPFICSNVFLAWGKRENIFYIRAWLWFLLSALLSNLLLAALFCC